MVIINKDNKFDKISEKIKKSVEFKNYQKFH